MITTRPPRIFVLGNVTKAEYQSLFPVLRTIDLEHGADIKVGGGREDVLNERGLAIDWIEPYAAFRPDVVLMCLHSEPWKQGNRLTDADEEDSGTWFLQRWERALAKHSDLSSIPRILLHRSRKPTPHSPDRFFRVLGHDSDDHGVLLALREALRATAHRVPRVFISYSSKDKRFVRRLSNDLKNRNVMVWLDEAELRVGDSLIESLRNALDAVDFVVAVVSEHSVKCEWVRRELDIAMNHEINHKRLVVIPVCKTNCELPGFLKGKVYADFSAPGLYQRSFERLVARIVSSEG